MAVFLSISRKEVFANNLLMREVKQPKLRERRLKIRSIMEWVPKVYRISDVTLGPPGAGHSHT